MSLPLLTTKLHPPTLHTSLVARPRLIAMLDEAVRRPLTIVSAPAGSGKTTTLLEWTRQVKSPVAWLTLDDGDNDPARFWTYFIAALQETHPGAGDDVLAMLRAESRPPVVSLLTFLLNEIATFSSDSVLVLDDYHTIHAPEIHDGLTFLIDHLPAQMHLVIASRADPPFPLARWRGRGQLTELRAQDLRFTLEECMTFLNQIMGFELSKDETGALMQRTEGWIAGLLLAALSLQGRPAADQSAFIKAFTGSQHYVVDYLMEEVFSRQPAHVQRFLLLTSILDRMTAPLCDALAGPESSKDGRAGSSQQILDYLERANLFIIPLDTERKWYRYHSLFADVLRHKLEQTEPHRVPELHSRAAAWFEKQELIDDAIGHALAAGDADWAVRLVEEHIDGMLRRGEGETLRRWLSALPQDILRARPRLALAQALIEFNAGRLEMVEPLLANAERALATSPANSDTHSGADPTSALSNVPAGIALLRASLAGYRGDAEQMTNLARSALTYLSEDERGPRYSVRWNLALADRMRGRLAEAERAFAEIAAEGRATGELHLALSAGNFLGSVQRAQGHLTTALRTYQEDFQYASEMAAAQAPSVGMAHLGMAEVFYARNELELALRHANEGIPLARHLTSTQSLASGLATLAWIRQARGDPAAALSAMEEGYLVIPTQQVVALGNPVPAERARLLLVQGKVTEAAQWIHMRGVDENDPFSYPREREYLILARVLLAQHAPERALGLLERLGGLAQTQGRIESIIEAQILQALALRAMGDPAHATTALVQALTLAAPEGYVRVFVDEGEPLRFLILAFRLQIAKSSGDESLLTFVDQIIAAFSGADRVLPTQSAIKNQEHLHRTEPKAPPVGQVQVSKILEEPLSARELEILRLIAAGRSTQEIAEELVIAVGTVRTHLKNIYGKLDAHSRLQAVERARALDLL